jgi:hypothetical protein
MKEKERFSEEIINAHLVNKAYKGVYRTKSKSVNDVTRYNPVYTAEF